MKKVFLTATALLTLATISCKKSETDNNNQQNVQLSAIQMLLLGTTNPNDANASATWHLDSVLENGSVAHYGWSDYIFRVDSVTTHDLPNNQFYTQSYKVNQDSLFMMDKFIGIMSFPTLEQLVIDETMRGEGIYYLTKVN